MLAFYATVQSFFATATDRLKGEEKGATAVEYGIMVAGIAVLVMGTVFLIGGQLDVLFGDVLDTLGG
ncbi:Flp family type IVb pilin [Arthrobacter sp. I2-34]|uniref:Flp family type IVb pilin n=1 Tax=Arthrobacter hankyongi TaxID=2904801 RepID=A0ABS9L4L7_9MICC|nr:Flp family type IVb pilin [Arthrobacter hankyongi]MCG2621616.1 Flp family type IVb pilin [Arthrobacter hankyongi]